MILGHLGAVAEMNNGEEVMKAYAGLLGRNASFQSRNIGGTNI